MGNSPMKPFPLDDYVIAAIDRDAQDLAVITLLQFVFGLSEAQAWRFTAAESVIWQQYVAHGWPAVPHVCRGRLAWVPVIERAQAAHALGFISAMFEEFDASDVASIRADKLSAKRREYRGLLKRTGHTPWSLRADFLRRARIQLAAQELARVELDELVAFLRSYTRSSSRE